METLISQFTFLSDQPLHDKSFDLFTTEDLMKLFEIESYKAWVAVEQEREVEEAEATMQQAEDHFDRIMESTMEEFRYFEEEIERMSKSEVDSFIETAESGRKMEESAASVASKRYIIEASVNSSIASSKVHPS
ncbi:hypothetical protein PHAVU_002G250100 [Phaseolus vulgaris]|uniref:Uncharacterized protein n=1 Tax=Phaseolus vulgaris TaxID=3885 RepID=V7CMZ2_PHAVU|nr:hypothetical protein PHAVU_002G250100g [Phaseolus vulgaris]ESW31582.1 hypothetical protein PHAVU_002G250100g [Phaseolus vulgaris]